MTFNSTLCCVLAVKPGTDMTTVRAILNALGLPFTEETPRYYLWTGKQFNLWDMNASDILHEVAHWLVATEEERISPEFGLGLAPEPGCQIAPMTVSKEEAKSKERLASALGIQMERALGMHWESTYALHSWDDTNHSFDEQLRILKSFGLLNTNELPSFLTVCGE